MHAILRRVFAAIRESQRDSVPKPRVARNALPWVIVQAFRKGQITHAQVGELLELNRFETDGFLKNAQAFRLSESEEFSSDLESLRRIAK